MNPLLTHIARWIAPITIALSLPVVLAYAQEVTSDRASTTPAIVETTPEVTLMDYTSTDPIDAPIGEVMGTSTETDATSTASTTEQQAPAENPAGGSSDPAPEPALEIPAPEASTTPEIPLVPQAPVEDL